MSKASDFGVRWVDEHLPELQAGRLEPFDVIAYVMHWCDAHRDLWDSEGLDEVAHHAVHRAQYHYEAERGVGDDIADDPYYEEVNQ